MAAAVTVRATNAVHKARLFVAVEAIVKLRLLSETSVSKVLIAVLLCVAAVATFSGDLLD